VSLVESGNCSLKQGQTHLVNPALSCYETKIQIEDSHSIRDIVEHVALNFYVISEELTTLYFICTKVSENSLSLSNSGGFMNSFQMSSLIYCR
jgi:hypothetical protein